jgi:hypothetical protein
MIANFPQGMDARSGACNPDRWFTLDPGAAAIRVDRKNQ